MRVPQLSDKNLKILLVVVLFITIVVALITLTKTKVAPITGAVSGTANTDLTISNYIAVNVEGAIEFGPGQVNPLNVTAELDASPAGGIINGTWVDVNQSIRVRNDGNIMINLSVKSSQAAATWIGPNSETYFIAINATGGQCFQYVKCAIGRQGNLNTAMNANQTIAIMRIIKNPLMRHIRLISMRYFHLC